VSFGQVHHPRQLLLGSMVKRQPVGRRSAAFLYCSPLLASNAIADDRRHLGGLFAMLGGGGGTWELGWWEGRGGGSRCPGGAGPCTRAQSVTSASNTGRRRAEARGFLAAVSLLASTGERTRLLRTASGHSPLQWVETVAGSMPIAMALRGPAPFVHRDRLPLHRRPAARPRLRARRWCLAGFCLRAAAPLRSTSTRWSPIAPASQAPTAPAGARMLSGTQALLRPPHANCGADKTANVTG